MATQLSQVTIDAVAYIRKVLYYEGVPPCDNTLKDTSQYRLRFDGSL